MPSLAACEKLADHCAETVIELLQARGIEEVPKWVRKGAAMRAAAAGVVRASVVRECAIPALLHFCTFAVMQFADCQVARRFSACCSRTPAGSCASRSLPVAYPTPSVESNASAFRQSWFINWLVVASSWPRPLSKPLSRTMTCIAAWRKWGVDRHWFECTSEPSCTIRSRFCVSGI